MPHLTRDRVWALSLIWALLLCHGAFGALHVIPDPVLPPSPAGEHTITHQPSDAHNGAPDEHLASHHAEYFAVLIGTLLGALGLWLLLLNHRRDGTAPASRLVSPPPARVSNLPRGPTLPFLQVLRL